MKKLYWAIIIIVAVFSVYFFIRPSYPDIVTPKPVFGNPDAKVNIVEFTDYECPACGRAHPVTKQILEKYGENVSYQYKYFPLTTIHPHSYKAALAAECANDQGKLFEYADMLFTNQQALEVSDMKEYAKELGLDTKSFNACLDTSAKKRIVDGDMREGTLKGVRATPSIYINDELLESWDYANYEARILQILQS